jgi:hypothetical protein
MRIAVIVLISCVLFGCPGNGPTDGGMDATCSIEVDIGRGDRDSFLPFADGDPQEVLLGFQGFRLLSISVRIAGSTASDAELSIFVEVDDSTVVVNQAHRNLVLASAPDGAGVVEGYLIFFNDAPVSEIVGHTGTLEIIARSGGCVGTDVLAIDLRDDDMCVSYDAGLDDAGVIDGGIPDGAVSCGDGG